MLSSDSGENFRDYRRRGVQVFTIELSIEEEKASEHVQLYFIRMAKLKASRSSGRVEYELKAGRCARFLMAASAECAQSAVKSSSESVLNIPACRTPALGRLPGFNLLRLDKTPRGSYSAIS